MRFYGGNSKRVIKKHSSFGFDGVYYSWDMAMFIMRLISKLKPGDKFWIPYTKEWGVIEKIEFSKRELKHFRRPVKRFSDEELDRVEKVSGIKRTFRSPYSSHPVMGWHLDEPRVSVRGSNGNIYYVYDIEHWNQEGANEDDVIAFNRRVGLPDDYKPTWRQWY